MSAKISKCKSSAFSWLLGLWGDEGFGKLEKEKKKCKSSASLRSTLLIAPIVTKPSSEASMATGSYFAEPSVCLSQNMPRAMYKPNVFSAVLGV